MTLTQEEHDLVRDTVKRLNRPENGYTFSTVQGLMDIILRLTNGKQAD